MQIWEVEMKNTARLNIHAVTLIGVVAASFTTLPVHAQSPDAAPERNANIWDGFAHQPSRQQIREDETARGLRGSDLHRKQEDAEMAATCRKLLQAAGNHGC
jgi:hypothetical protein